MVGQLAFAAVTILGAVSDASSTGVGPLNLLGPPFAKPSWPLGFVPSPVQRPELSFKVQPRRVTHTPLPEFLRGLEQGGSSLDSGTGDLPFKIPALLLLSAKLLSSVRHSYW